MKPPAPLLGVPFLAFGVLLAASLCSQNASAVPTDIWWVGNSATPVGPLGYADVNDSRYGGNWSTNATTFAALTIDPKPGNANFNFNGSNANRTIVYTGDSNIFNSTYSTTGTTTFTSALGSHTITIDDGGTVLLNSGNGAVTLGSGVDISAKSFTIQNDSSSSYTLNNNLGIASGKTLSVTGSGTGAFVFNGTQSGGGTVTVASTATLAGTGTFGGATTISGTHSAGLVGTVGTQTFTGGVTYNSGSIFSWDLNANAHGTAGTNYDFVTTGAGSGKIADAKSGSIFNVVLGNAVNLNDAFWSTTKTWAMTDIFTSFTGSFNTTVNSSANPLTQGAFTITGGGSTLTWSAVPEPTGALAGALLALGLLRRRRAA